MVDPLAVDFAAWSTYAYVLDNPISFIDPDGKNPEPPLTLLNASYTYTYTQSGEHIITKTLTETTFYAPGEYKGSGVRGLENPNSDSYVTETKVTKTAITLSPANDSSRSDLYESVETQNSQVTNLTEFSDPNRLLISGSGESTTTTDPDATADIVMNEAIGELNNTLNSGGTHLFQPFSPTQVNNVLLGTATTGAGSGVLNLVTHGASKTGPLGVYLGVFTLSAKTGHWITNTGGWSKIVHGGKTREFYSATSASQSDKKRFRTGNFKY